MRPPRAALLGLAGLLGLAVWTAASAAWSPVPSLARDEALLVAFYAVVFTIAVTTLRTPGVRRIAVELVALGSVVLALGGRRAPPDRRPARGPPLGGAVWATRSSIRTRSPRSS